MPKSFSKAKIPDFAGFGDPQNPTFIFASGIFMGPAIYSRLLRSVAGRGFYAVGVPSVTSLTETFETPTDVAQDFWNRIDRLYEVKALQSPIAAIGGHSAGGWLAIAAAIEREESSPGIVLVNASAGEDYNLAMKHRLKAVTDITRQVFVSLGYGTGDVFENWIRINSAHRKLVKLMEDFTLEDDLLNFSEHQFHHSQVIHTDRDYLVTDVAIAAQEAALRIHRTLLPGHHGSCIPEGERFGASVGNALRSNNELFEYLGVEPGSESGRSIS